MLDSTKYVKNSLHTMILKMADVFFDILLISKTSLHSKLGKDPI